LDNCLSFAGFSYGLTGWNPYRETISEFTNGLDLPVHETALYRFYDRFRPETIADLLADGRPVSFKKPFGIWPWGNDRIDADPDPAKKRLRFSRLREQSLKDIETHRLRLLLLFRYLQHEGYRPDRFGTIKGYFLINRARERRFLVQAGNHRVALLALLGHKDVVVAHHVEYVESINEQDCQSWHYVENGECSEEEALRYFNNWFVVNGKQQVDRFHILDGYPS
jgi:hypothetical protein